MSSKRLSLRFNLNNPGDLAAWEYLHRLDGDSINKEIISMINASKQNILQYASHKGICRDLFRQKR